MKQKTVGTYEVGYECIQLVIREGTGGEFWFLPGDIKTPRIKIGVDETWLIVRTALLHEIQELILARLKCRFHPFDDLGNAHDSYIFTIDHHNFSDLCYRVSEFLDSCIPDLKKAYREWHKKGGKK